jgi:hypothetical protein
LPLIYVPAFEECPVCTEQMFPQLSSIVAELGFPNKKMDVWIDKKWWFSKHIPNDIREYVKKCWLFWFMKKFLLNTEDFALFYNIRENILLKLFIAGSLYNVRISGNLKIVIFACFCTNLTPATSGASYTCARHVGRDLNCYFPTPSYHRRSVWFATYVAGRECLSLPTVGGEEPNKTTAKSLGLFLYLYSLCTFEIYKPEASYCIYIWTLSTEC